MSSLRFSRWGRPALSAFAFVFAAIAGVAVAAVPGSDGTAALPRVIAKYAPSAKITASFPTQQKILDVTVAPGFYLVEATVNLTASGSRGKAAAEGPAPQCGVSGPGFNQTANLTIGVGVFHPKGHTGGNTAFVETLNTPLALGGLAALTQQSTLTLWCAHSDSGKPRIRAGGQLFLVPVGGIDQR